jgi:hypothetical protein
MITQKLNVRQCWLLSLVWHQSIWFPVAYNLLCAYADLQGWTQFNSGQWGQSEGKLLPFFFQMMWKKYKVQLIEKNGRFTIYSQNWRWLAFAMRYSNLPQCLTCIMCRAKFSICCLAPKSVYETPDLNSIGGLYSKWLACETNQWVERNSEIYMQLLMAGSL